MIPSYDRTRTTKEPLTQPVDRENPYLTLSSGQSLYLEGDAAQACFRLKEGLVRLMRIKPDGRSITLRHILPGDLFGEEALIGATRFADAQAATAAVVEVIDPRQVRHHAMDVLSSLVDQTQRLMNHEYHVQVGDLQTRVARYLLRLVGTPLASKDMNDRWQISASHELIAEGTSSTRESVSKELSELRYAGLIATGYRNITLLDPDGLAEVAADVF